MYSAAFMPVIPLFKYQLIGDIARASTWILKNILAARAMVKTCITIELMFTCSYILLTMLFVHYIGLIGTAIAFAINAVGPWSFALAARSHECVFVHVSSDFVFDGTKKSPYMETDLPNPQSAYARSKYAGELLVQNAGGKYFIVRTAWLYGDEGKNFPTAIIERAHAGEKLSVVEDQIGCPTYAKDLAEAIFALTQTKAYGLYHGVNKGSTSWYSFARAILKEIGLDAPLRAQTTQQYLESSGKVVAARPERSVLATDKLKKASGYTFRPWQEALHEWAEKKKV